MEKIIPLESEVLPNNCYVFKHSTRCPISSHAAEEVKAHSWELPLYWINVIEQRPLSNWIEKEYGVQHSSPQLLHIRDGKVVSTLSHDAISRASFTTQAMR